MSDKRKCWRINRRLFVHYCNIFRRLLTLNALPTGWLGSLVAGGRTSPADKTNPTGMFPWRVCDLFVSSIKEPDWFPMLLFRVWDLNAFHSMRPLNESCLTAWNSNSSLHHLWPVRYFPMPLVLDPSRPLYIGPVYRDSFMIPNVTVMRIIRFSGPSRAALDAVWISFPYTVQGMTSEDNK